MQTLVCLLASAEDSKVNYEAAIEVNPHSVILCHTREAGAAARQLKARITDALGPEIKKVEVPAYDLDAIQDVAENLFMALQNKSAVLHYTGGTKPMALGFFEEFRGSGCSLLYIDLPGRTMWWRGPEGFYQKPMRAD